jgi:hypothetical protein
VVTIAAAAAVANTLSNSEELVANPDAWSLKLNAQGNLAPTILDLFANDTGSILNANITTFGPPYGNLVWNESKSYYVFSVTGHRSGALLLAGASLTAVVTLGL